VLHDTVRTIIAQANTPYRVTAEIGAAGSGQSNAVIVRVHEAREYLLKSPHLIRESHPYLCVNERICGLLAIQCGLPAMDLAVIHFQGRPCIGFAKIERNSLAAVATHRGILDQLENPGLLYDLAAFDAWIRNIDRHPRNVFARRTSRSSQSYELMMGDHDRATLVPIDGLVPATVDRFPHLDSGQAWISAGEVRARLTDLKLLYAAADRLRSMCSADDIKTIVASTPSAWLAVNDQNYLRDFLTSRLKTLNELIERRAREVLPALFT
jgi:hypothetical protein